MGKLILIAAILVIVWWALKSRLPPGTGGEPPRSAAPEDMVRCAHCGVHLPRSESYARDGRFFCSEEHLRLHR